MVVFVLNVSDRAVPSFQCFISLKTVRELIRFINTQHKHSFSQKKKKPTHTHTHPVEKDMVNFTKLTKQQNRATLSICIALAAFFYLHTFKSQQYDMDPRYENYQQCLRTIL